MINNLPGNLPKQRAKEYSSGKPEGKKATYHNIPNNEIAYPIHKDMSKSTKQTKLTVNAVRIVNSYPVITQAKKEINKTRMGTVFQSALDSS